jgi:carbon monoxide dehydrogenase subunit G
MASLEISASILLAAPPERVWDVAMNWQRQGEWIPATQVRGGTGVGGRVRARTGLGPVGFTDTMIITEWDPPRRCAVRHIGPVAWGTGLFEVVPRGDRTEFRWAEEVRVPVPAAAAPAVLALARWTIVPFSERALSYALRRLALLV